MVLRNVHAAIFKVDEQQGLLDTTGNSAQRYVAAWMGGEFGGEWIHGYVWLSPFTVQPETTTTSFIGFSPIQGFPDGSDGKESACNAGDQGSILGLGRSPGKGQGNPFQYSCLENPHTQRNPVGYSPWGGKRVRHD